MHNMVTIFYILFTVHLEIILDNNKLDAVFLTVFISCLYMFRATSAHHQEDQGVHQVDYYPEWLLHVLNVRRCGFAVYFSLFIIVAVLMGDFSRITQCSNFVEEENIYLIRARPPGKL